MMKVKTTQEVNSADTVDSSLNRNSCLQELSRLSKIGVMVTLMLCPIGIFAEFLIRGSLGLASVGFMVGSICSVVNLQIIGRSLAPLLHGVGSIFWSMQGFVLSLVGLATLSYWLVINWSGMTIGFAFGLASPVVFGLVFLLAPKM